MVQKIVFGAGALLLIRFLLIGSFQDVFALALATAGYFAFQYLESKKKTTSDIEFERLQAEVEELKSTVSSLSLSSGIKKLSK